MLHCLKDNPMRAADWRWLRAVGVAEGTQPPATRRRDGNKGYKLINDAIAFRREFERRPNDADKCELAALSPEIFWAHHIWQSSNAMLRWQVEALCLAKESDFDIGYECGLAPEIVQTYMDLFFDVREKLCHPGYIRTCVLGPAVPRGLSEREYDLLWKMYGYWLGPLVLKAVFSTFAQPDWCMRPDAVGAALQDDALGTLKLKAALAAKTVPINSHTQLELLHAFTKFIEVERMTDSAGQAQSQILGHIGALFEALPFGISGRNPRDGNKRLAQGPTAYFDEHGVELTYEELMMVSIDNIPANANELISVRYPDDPDVARAQGGVAP